MRISDWSSDVCSSDLDETVGAAVAELNRYSATQIVVADSRVAAMRMSGIVKTGDAGEFTTLVGAMLPVASRKNAHGDIELYYAPSVTVIKFNSRLAIPRCRVVCCPARTSVV